MAGPGVEYGIGAGDVKLETMVKTFAIIAFERGRTHQNEEIYTRTGVGWEQEEQIAENCGY